MTDPTPDIPETPNSQANALPLQAAELIAEVGPSGFTLANVGERAGYSRGLATHHFGSKGAMMQRLVASVTSGFRAEVFGESA